MSNEWFDIAYINHDEAILHGQIADERGEREVRVSLTKEQVRAVEDLNFKHQMEMNKLLRGWAA